MQTFQELVAAYKAEHGLKDRDLGVRLGVAQQTASNWVSGRAVPEIERANALAAAMGLDEGVVADAISYARRRRASNMDEAMALLTRLEATVARLEDRIAELERRAPLLDPRGRSRGR